MTSTNTGPIFNTTMDPSNSIQWHPPAGYTWTTRTTSAPVKPTYSPRLFKDKKTGNQFYKADRIPEDDSELSENIAKWVGAARYDAGMRVPTLDGVEVAFVGDWIVRDDAGVVYIYPDEDFTNEFVPA